MYFCQVTSVVKVKDYLNCAELTVQKIQIVPYLKLSNYFTAVRYP